MRRGWKLVHVGYVFQPTGSQSRERMLHSGEMTVVSGQVLGVYVLAGAYSERRS